jgi:hypothetical protein
MSAKQVLAGIAMACLAAAGQGAGVAGAAAQGAAAEDRAAVAAAETGALSPFARQLAKDVAGNWVIVRCERGVGPAGWNCCEYTKPDEVAQWESFRLIEATVRPLEKAYGEASLTLWLTPAGLSAFRSPAWKHRDQPAARLFGATRERLLFVSGRLTETERWRAAERRLAETYKFKPSASPDDTPAGALARAKRSAAVAKELRANLSEFRCSLSHQGPQGKGKYYSLRMSVRRLTPVVPNPPRLLTAQITEQEAGRIVDALEAAGVLGRLEVPPAGVIVGPPEGCYILFVERRDQFDTLQMLPRYVVLPLEADTFRFFDALHKALDKDAAKVMQPFLKPLEERREEVKRGENRDAGAAGRPYPRCAPPVELVERTFRLKVVDEQGRSVANASMVLGDPEIIGGALGTDEQGEISISGRPMDKVFVFVGGRLRATVDLGNLDPQRLNVIALESAR